MVFVLIGILAVSWLSVRANARAWFVASHVYYDFPFVNIIGLTLTSIGLACAQYLSLLAWRAKEGLSGLGLIQIFSGIERHLLLTVLATVMLALVALSAFLSCLLSAWRMGYVAALPVSELIPLETRRSSVRRVTRRSSATRFVYDQLAEAARVYRTYIADKTVSQERKESATAFAVMTVIWCLLVGPAAYVVACVFYRRLRVLAER